MNQVVTDFWRQILRHDIHSCIIPVSMYRNPHLISPDTLILSGDQDGIPTFPSVYGRVRSWLLQDQGSAQPELYYGLAIHKKVTNYPFEN